MAYEIKLKGHLDRQHDQWFKDFAVKLEPNGQTTLTGTVADQAALFGVLMRIRDLGIPLLSVAELDFKCDEKNSRYLAAD